jgi:hypothetical protein
MSGVPWYEFENAARDIARAGRRLLQDDTGAPGVAFLGTVAVDGHPRMHPFIPAIVSEHLLAFVIRSPKQRDLDRTGMYAAHSLLGHNDESFFATGAARQIGDDQARENRGRGHALQRHRRATRALRVHYRTGALDYVEHPDESRVPELATPVEPVARAPAQNRRSAPDLRAPNARIERRQMRAAGRAISAHMRSRRSTRVTPVRWFRARFSWGGPARSIDRMAARMRGCSRGGTQRRLRRRRRARMAARARSCPPTTTRNTSIAGCQRTSPSLTM